MTQPLPTNLHPSQCYRLLDPDQDTLREGDEMLSLCFGQSQWHPIDKTKCGDTTSRNRTYRRPFTPPAPVKVQEFWRLLQFGEAMQRDDKFFSHGNNFVPVSPVEFGNKIHIFCRPVIRRVTVPVAAPAPVADAPKAEAMAAAYSALEYLEAQTKADMDTVHQLHHDTYKHRLDCIQQALKAMDISRVSNAPKAEPVTESGPFLVSVDGHEAPTMEHDTIEDARAEAERLARQEHPAQVRLLRQVAVAKAEVTVKWEKQ